MMVKSGFTKTLGSVLLAAGMAMAGNYSTWAKYRTVTVNTTGLGLSASVTKIPVPIRFDATNHADVLNGGTQILAGGADIRVTKADGTTDVPFEIESATTGATGAALIWVLADTVKANNTAGATFRVYWGKTGATTLSNATAVFDTANGFAAVWHMKETGLTVGGTISDATGAGNTAKVVVNGTGVAPSDTAGALGTGKNFSGNIAGTSDGNGGYFAVKDSATTALTMNTNNGPYTLSAWANPNVCSSTNRIAIISKYNNNNVVATRAYALQTASSGASWRMVNNPSSLSTFNANNEYVSDTTCTTGTWQYVVGTYELATTADTTAASALGVKISLNGSPFKLGTRATQATGSSIGSSAPVFIGRLDGASANQRYMRGILDEVRVSKVARSADWVKLEYETQRPTGGTAVTIDSAKNPNAVSYAAWTGHRTIKLNTSATGANVPGTVTNFPVLIRLGAGESAILSAAKAGGADIRFSKSDDATPLAYQIESWGPSSAAIWVKVDSVKGNDAVQTIRLHYGNNAATAQSSGAAVFDTANNFVSVWHMNGATDDTSATAYGYVATAIGTPGAGTGAVGPARLFNGTSQYFQALGTASSAMSFAAESSYTFSAWVRSDSVSATGSNTGHAIVTKGDHQWALAVFGATAPNRYYEITTKAANGWRQTTTRPRAYASYGGDTANSKIGVWRFVTGSWNGANTAAANGRVYTDGALQFDTTFNVSTNINTARQTARDVHIGVLSNEGTGSTNATGTLVRYFAGALDEITISRGVRDSNWVKLSYQNQKASNSLTDIGNGATVPGAPTGVTGVAGVAQVAVSWVAPVSDGGATITGYKAVAVSDTTKSCTTTGTLTCIVTGLTNGTAYTFTVKATNSLGTSAASAASAAVTPNATVPGAPTGVTGAAGAANSGTVTVSWTAPVNNGGSAITGYKAMAVSDTTKTCSTTSAVTCAITGLTNGTAYTFVVRAINAVGSSAASTASAAVTVTGVAPGTLMISVGSFTKAYTFQLPEATAALTENLTMSIADAAGKTVWERTINPAESKTRTLTWNGLTSKGSKVSAGMYIVRIHVAGASSSQNFIQAGVKLLND
jgi:hypothetical protein